MQMPKFCITGKMCWVMRAIRRSSRANSAMIYPIHPRRCRRCMTSHPFLRDWNGDGKDDWGISLHAKVNQQGFFHFLTLAAPYVISPSNKYFYFNPDDMKPLINSEGHHRALEDYVKFLANGPSEQIGWTLEQGWSPFLTGHA